MEPVFTLDDLVEISEWASQECARQNVGPLFVGGMIRAYCSDTAQNIARRRRCISPTDILDLGRTLMLNKDLTFRSVPVTFRDGTTGIPAHNIERAVFNLCAAWNDARLTAEDFYQEFEEIHPFVDGNGRTGSVLYNLLLNGYKKVEAPPMFQRR